MSRANELTFDPGALSAAQRAGDACVVCHKKWPRPRVRIGRLPAGSGVFVCADCAPALPDPHATEPLTTPVGDTGPAARRPVPAGVQL
ncbi:hypothetical protein ACRYCC_41560 [Actinomadura scrupuli]|uniref:hypothetical protein n=1 Tax=Actinomadura scrupuli TaxID=559629 RepID=UPI003D959D64